MHLKTLKGVEIDVGNFTHCFSFNRSNPNNAVPVKYIAIALNIKLAQFISYSPETFCLFGAQGDFSGDEVTNIFGSNAYGTRGI